MTEVDLSQWVGNVERLEDAIYPTPAVALANTLNVDGFDDREGAPLPPLWYWLYFLPLARMDAVGADGHPKRGGFLPPVALERRMWASSDILMTGEGLRIGDAVSKVSEVVSVSEKAGSAGPLVFVTVKHTVSSARGVEVEETQNIVYLDMPKQFIEPPPNPLPQTLDWQESVVIDPVLLFRFSALTFNSHRIHYDRPYAMDAEKYPGLVVHGPLQALLLLEAARRHNPQREVAGYNFRGTRPIFDFDRMTVSGVADGDDAHKLLTANTAGQIGTQAKVKWR